MAVNALASTVPLTVRILVYMHRQGAKPVHYRVIAERLDERNTRKVQATCVRLAHQGKLRWCGEGVYGLPQEGH